MTTHFHDAVNDLCWALQVRFAVHEALDRNDMPNVRVLNRAADAACARLSGPFMAEYMEVLGR